MVKPYWDRLGCDISRVPTSDACQKKPHSMRVLSINCCLLVKLYITLEQKFFKTDECCIKNLFLLWNNKYFLILPLSVISTQPCISGQTMHLPGGEKRWKGERGGARHSAVFAAGSKMPLCLVCRQLWFSYIFMGIPLPPGAF